MSVEISRQPDPTLIADTMLKENWIVGLGYLEGYVFLRVLSREVTYLIYDPIQEITATNLLGIPARTFIPVQKFGSSALNATDIFAVLKDFHLYQAFVGISPSGTRLFYNTDSTDQRQLDVAPHGTNADFRFGYVDGFTSPLLKPSPASEFFVPPQITYQWGVFNPYNTQISPLFWFIVNRMEIAVIKDATLITKILTGAVPARLANIGGLFPPKYNRKEMWKVTPIRLDATASQIQAGVTGTGPALG